MAPDGERAPQPAASGSDSSIAAPSAVSGATPVNPETALLLACANLLSQHCPSIQSSSLSLHLPVLVDLLGRGSVATQSIQEFQANNLDTFSPTRKRQRFDQTPSSSGVPLPSTNCAAAVDGLESLVKLAAARPQATLPAPEANSPSDRPISYVTLDATGTHWIISTPVQGGLLRHFLPPVESRLDELVAVEPDAFESQSGSRSLPSSAGLVSTASVFEDTDGSQRLREASDPPFSCLVSEQAFTADTSPVSEHIQEESTSAPASQPLARDLEGATEEASSTPASDAATVYAPSPTLAADPSLTGTADSQIQPSAEASLGKVSLDTYWAASPDSSWVAADVLPQTHLPMFCRHMETDSVEMCHSITSDKGSTTRTCCTEDEFPLDGEKVGTTEAYSEMAKKLPKLAGVIFDRVHARWVSTYHDKETRKVMRKYFGVRKHGFEQAYKMAVRHRKMKLLSKQSKGESEKTLPGAGADSTVGCLTEAACFFDGEVDTMNKNVCYETLFKTLPRVTGVSYDSYAMKFRAGFMSNGKWNVKDFPIRKYGTFAEAYRRAVACRLGNSRVESSRKTDAGQKSALRSGEYAVQP